VLAAYRAGELVTLEKNGGYSGKDPKPNSVPVAAYGSPVAGTANAYMAGAAVSPAASTQNPGQLKLPDERNGLLFVFRVFDRLSYALVMQSTGVIRINDVVQTP